MPYSFYSSYCIIRRLTCPQAPIQLSRAGAKAQRSVERALRVDFSQVNLPTNACPEKSRVRRRSAEHALGGSTQNGSRTQVVRPRKVSPTHNAYSRLGLLHEHTLLLLFFVLYRSQANLGSTESASVYPDRRPKTQATDQRLTPADPNPKSNTNPGPGSDPKPEDTSSEPATGSSIHKRH
ncbi:hypothetical protein MAPG_10802 [Magnaporthiopsis poae ATCC 64411]|uniref:Uncharacterized protein n=1 Tax=Magnaporthiopsis poae (strain ATCC 64411 / 73-15) TaxID=644358 RepID=A0A0C4EDK0_MAGP6|nr:hypothetical protein MAPG_10802 [Magnaporthiopsis poae ATCC 64411]